MIVRIDLSLWWSHSILIIVISAFRISTNDSKKWIMISDFTSAIQIIRLLLTSL